MFRFLGILVVAGALCASAFAAASTMSLGSTPTIQVGSVGTQCQSGPLTVTNNFNDITTTLYPYGEVTSVNISGVDPACNGAHIFVEGFDAAGTMLGTMGYDWNASTPGQLATINGAGPYKIYFGDKGDGSLPGALRADQLAKYVIWFSVY